MTPVRLSLPWLVVLLALTPPAAVLAPSAAAATSARPNAALAEDALNAFFHDLDRSSKTVAAGFDDGRVGAPEFPERAALLERFLRRLARIDELRAREIAGEANRGFLELRGERLNTELGALHDENADRLALYEAIAGLANVRVDDVGRLRASKLAILCRRGVWVQDPRGHWAQKS